MADNPGCLLGIIKAITTAMAGNKEDTVVETLPYALCDNFLSQDELSLYAVLKAELEGQWVVCPKVRLADIFYPNPSDPTKRQGYFNRIQSKHVDFVICDELTMTPKLLVELDDASHKKKNRQQRDEQVNGICSAAGIGIAHIKSKGSGYSKSDVEQYILPHLMGIANVVAEVLPEEITPNEVTTPVEIPKDGENPSCPKCGGSMVKRTAKKGANAGNEFYGCSSYPQCRGIVE